MVNVITFVSTSSNKGKDKEKKKKKTKKRKKTKTKKRKKTKTNRQDVKLWKLWNNLCLHQLKRPLVNFSSPCQLPFTRNLSFDYPWSSFDLDLDHLLIILANSLSLEVYLLIGITFYHSCDHCDPQTHTHKKNVYWNKMQKYRKANKPFWWISEDAKQLTWGSLRMSVRRKQLLHRPVGNHIIVLKLTLTVLQIVGFGSAPYNDRVC